MSQSVSESGEAEAAMDSGDSGLGNNTHNNHKDSNSTVLYR